MMAAVTANIEDLKGRYEVGQHPLLGGACVIIPEKEFSQEIENSLRHQGHRILHNAHNGQPAVFISIKQNPRNQTPKPDTPIEQRTAAEPEPKKPKRGEPYCDEENELLTKLWNQKPQLKTKEIAKEFTLVYPERTGYSVKNRLQQLLDEGTITSRHKKVADRRKKETEVEKKTTEKTAEKETATAYQKGYEAGKAEKEKELLEARNAVVDAHHLAESYLMQLKEADEKLEGYIDGVNCQIIMQALEVKEIEQVDFVIPQKLRRLYVDAQLSGSADLRAEFRSKVAQLLEVF